MDTVTSGADCLKMTLQNRYDAILMDHLMPEMDGIECLHAIRSQTGGINQATPVIVLTANAGGEYQSLYKREGFDDYLIKPVVGTQLEAMLIKHLPKEVVSLTGDGASVGVIESPIRAYKKKMAVMITTESVCDLPKDMKEKNHIAVIPYRVVTEKGEFLDGIETESDGIMSYMSEKGGIARSEEPSVAEYEEFFAEQLTKAQYIIHLSVAKNTSKGYANALEASKAFDNVTVLDSGHLSSGMGLMAMQAAEYAADGMSAEDITNEIKSMKERVRTSFVMGSTEYMARTGRLSQNISALCQALMLHPVLVLKNSKIGVGIVRMGTRERTRRKYISSTLKYSGTIDTSILFITYAGMSKRDLDSVIEQIQSRVQFQQIICQKASPAVSTNCGPGTFGLLFMTK